MNAPAIDHLCTVRDLLRHAVTRFNQSGLFFGHGQVDALEEATFLVIRALALPLERSDLFLDARLSRAEAAALFELIERRVDRREPAAYLLNESWLQGYRFYVDRRTIVPRSFVAELLKDGLAPWIDDPSAIRRVLDLCTGSGCLAVIAAEAFALAQVDAVDLSSDALAVAARNVDAYSLGDRVRLIESDLFEQVGQARYDLIISNPPYVTAASMATLPREYTHEPRIALEGGEDGMAIVRQIIEAAGAHLAPGGLLVVEVGDGRAAVEIEFEQVPMTWLTTSAGDDMVFMVHAEDLPG